jgi:hypothetical protein
MAEIFNDNVPPAAPDSNGHAAMLLVESLIHSLVAASVISLAQAINVVDIAADVNAEIIASQDDDAESFQQSLRILEQLESSLNRDVPRE